MKTHDVLIISALAIAFLVIPVSAGEYMANGAPVDQIGNAAGFTPAAGYTNYFYFWNHGTAASTDTYESTYVASETAFPWGHGTLLKVAPSATLNATAWVALPVTSVGSYSGIHPKVRYGMIQMFDYTGKAGMNEVWILNGKDSITEFPVGWHTIGWAEYTIDLGSYYDFPRGMDMSAQMYNSDLATQMWVVIGGYGAKGEW